ncbi:hypothetical protein Tsubulata_022500 [Turnera subulata]|uniref:Uncharacterized protein n=1 Tax=Turnera subulata TaxID=218843 RepID=A0A9Q0JDD7_9ROSI|nr:hypothetical protein Tsubulata_022500 [Turnera subulata]
MIVLNFHSFELMLMYILCFLFLVRIQTFKWQDYISWQRKLNEAKASAAALKASITGLNSEPKPAESKWKAFFPDLPFKMQKWLLREMCMIKVSFIMFGANGAIRIFFSFNLVETCIFVC